MTEVAKACSIPEEISSVVQWSQALVSAVAGRAMGRASGLTPDRTSAQTQGQSLASGALAVDLTAGNGGDTEFLYRLVGDEGRVVAFDLQQQALDKTAERLARLGAKVIRPDPAAPVAPVTAAATVSAAAEVAEAQPLAQELLAGVSLVCGDHATWRTFVRGAPCAIMANLGYLPGGDKALVTTRQSTLCALEDGFSSLMAGGVVAVTCYTGHPGGTQEARAVEDKFAALKPAQWRVVKFSLPNREKAPFLLVAEKLVPFATPVAV